ncbi:MAG TPA: hypothetical protein VII78_13825 [Myxococcota bacterium]|jgi:hypothetical protein
MSPHAYPEASAARESNGRSPATQAASPGERWLYPASATLREGRALYFQRAGFDASTYTDRWVVLRVGKRFSFRIPNTSGRVRAIRLHDLHHVLTGFPTTWAGEGEIGAFELASGCRDHWAAWYLNFSAAVIGMFVAPRRVLLAFRRGRRQRNLYGEEFSDALLDETIGAARARLAIDAATS